MKYPKPQYSTIDHRPSTLVLNSFDGMVRHVHFTCPANAAAAMSEAEARAPMDAVAISQGFLPFGAGLVNSPYARPISDIIAETGPMDADLIAGMEAAMAAIVQSGSSINRTSDAEARKRDPQARERYDRFCVGLHSGTIEDAEEEAQLACGGAILVNHANHFQAMGLDTQIGTMTAEPTEHGFLMHIELDPMKLHRGAWQRASEIDPADDEDEPEIATGIGTVDRLELVRQSAQDAIDEQKAIGRERVYVVYSPETVEAVKEGRVAKDGTFDHRDEASLALQIAGRIVYRFDPRICMDPVIMEMDAPMIASAVMSAYEAGMTDGHEAGVSKIRKPLRAALGLDEEKA